MKILFVAPRYHTNQHALVKALQQKGHEVRFHVLRKGLNENHSLLTPIVIPTSRRLDALLDRIAKMGRRFDRTVYASPPLNDYMAVLREWLPDLMVIRDPQHTASAVAAIAARRLKVRTLLYTQGPVHAHTGARVRTLRHLGTRWLGGQWISPVLGDADSAPRAHPSFHYVPFVADPDAKQKDTWFLGDKVNVLGIGKFVPRKNHLLLLRAIDRLRATKDVTLTLVGEAVTKEHERHLASVMEFVDANFEPGVVTVLTNVAHAEMEQLYLKHDVFVLASRNESASVSVLEAMSHGLPVMCSTTNGTRHDVKDGVNGYVFKSDDENDLAAKLGAILESRERLALMGSESRRISLEDHHPDIVADRMLELAAK